MMQHFDYILCHGSGNRFLLFDAVKSPQLERFTAPMVAELCRQAAPNDGLLLLVRRGGEYGMRMFNTDGSEAEMCGNGIRCVARLAEIYLPEGQTAYPLWSGGKRHPISIEQPVWGNIPTRKVAIDIRLATDDFVPSLTTEGGFIEQPIPALDEALRFTYLNLGNPHLVAFVEAVDLDHLSRLGERVKELKELLPRGVNVSLVCCEGPNRIFVATYERGVGLTPSCGTAMTASSTASVLTGRCTMGEEIEVRNRGGMVRCCCTTTEGIVTTLSGNATFEAEGEVGIDFETGEVSLADEELIRTDEVEAYAQFLRSLNEA
ncbi:MAG: diaminopimelate epimerase [Alistipes sp.]|nr:diaminopimelate epimerase [Alistipes sp.]